MSRTYSNAVIHEEISPVERTFMANERGPICIVDGQGLSIHIDRGHLIVVDGIGRYRRERRYHKATHGLTRIVVLGATGTLSLEALRYCDRLGIAVVVIDPAEVRPSFVALPSGIDDARLRRVQAFAPDNDLGVDIARLLLTAKLDGQAKVLHQVFEAQKAEATVRTLRDGLDDVTSFDEMRQIEASAAACYFNEWSGSSLVIPKFITKDRAKVPDHWRRYDGRSSVLFANNGNRKAERPMNAILNYLFALVEVEAVLACNTLGIDPGLGIVHLDQRKRHSMALDLIEPVRPLVEAWTLDLLAQRSFRRSDFTETSDGHVRILAPLTHELAGSMSHWRKEIAPWAEKVAHLLGKALKGEYVASTPLTGGNQRSAQKKVQVRKTKEAINKEIARSKTLRPKQRPSREYSKTLRNCVDCGGPLSRGAHLRCPQCWETQPGQEIQTRKYRGEGIAKAREEDRRWRVEHSRERVDPDTFRMYILPGLQGVSLTRIMEACGVSKSTASTFRSGKRVPAERHWENLRELGNLP